MFLGRLKSNFICPMSAKMPHIRNAWITVVQKMAMKVCGFRHWCNMLRLNSSQNCFKNDGVCSTLIDWSEKSVLSKSNVLSLFISS